MEEVNEYIERCRLTSFGKVIAIQYSGECLESYPCQHYGKEIVFANYVHDCDRFCDTVMFANVIAKLGVVVPAHFVKHVYDELAETHPEVVKNVDYDYSDAEEYIRKHNLQLRGLVLDAPLSDDCTKTHPCEHSKKPIVFISHAHESKGDIVLFAKVVHVLARDTPEHVREYTNFMWVK